MSRGTLRFLNRELPFSPGDTVLDCLDRNGVTVASLCHLGNCRVCILRSVGGELPEQAQRALHSAARAGGVFLGCRCLAKDDLQIEPVDFMTEVPAKIESVRQLGEAVLQLKVRTNERLKFQAGQVIHLVRPSDGLTRPFAVASLPEEPCLELHVERRPQGAMSTWLARAQGEPVLVQGTVGDCFYMGEPQEPLLLVGSGVGAAALLGVLRTAVERNHKGATHVVHCVDSNTGAYCTDEFEHLTKVSGNKLRFSSLFEEGLGKARFEAALFEEVPDLHDFRVFLAGEPSLVRRLKRKAFGRGASLDKIHHLPFKGFRTSRSQQIQTRFRSADPSSK